ncbi:hypothetical protein BDV96DRAFT_667506 [Lophiotrema nucula]|uniref:Lysine-specific metallo-endopeptidase domain-containing protein n=1 Tax=Lophiotrema nucula TaxID=690887 RepID=A0A6A5YUN8_9PLEO|nr:hypothetical protein BDV96DRAFT_667506 [Lophiotrema nucula]
MKNLLRFLPTTLPLVVLAFAPAPQDTDSLLSFPPVTTPTPTSTPVFSPTILSPSPPSSISNPGWKDIQAYSEIVTPKANFTVESRLTDYRGCTGFHKSTVQYAFADALKIVGSVGKPAYILGREPGTKTPKDQAVNLPLATGALPERASRVPKRPGDAAEQRQISAHQSVWSGTAELLEHENARGEGAGCEDGVAPAENVESLRSNGMALLHEMFHTIATSYAGGWDAGISQPKAIDVIPSSSWTQKAYGAARSKWLAKRRKAEQQQLVYKNVDNCSFARFSFFPISLPPSLLSTKANGSSLDVYYALTRYMQQTFGVLPMEPKAGWGTPAIAEVAEEVKEPVIEGDVNDEVVDGEVSGQLLSDAELYGAMDSLGIVVGSECLFYGACASEFPHNKWYRCQRCTYTTQKSQGPVNPKFSYIGMETGTMIPAATYLTTPPPTNSAPTARIRMRVTFEDRTR